MYVIIFKITKILFSAHLGTAWYRMMPKIQLLDEIKDNDAILLQSCFPQGVIGLKNVKGILILNTLSKFVGIKTFSLII